MFFYWLLLFVPQVLSSWVNPQQINAGGCQPTGFAAPPQKRLANVRSVTLNITGTPFAVVYDSSGQYAFFAAVEGRATTGYLGVLDTSAFLPRVIQRVDLTPPGPAEVETADLRPFGVSLTNDGRKVLVAAGAGFFVVDAAKAKAGLPGAYLGFANGTTTAQRPGSAALQVFPSSDDQYAYVAQEFGPSSLPATNPSPGNIDIFALSNATSNQSVPANPITFHDFGYSISGITLSPDGKLLYVTSEQADPQGTLPGYISVVELPGFSVNSSVLAGCSPVRTLVSADGTVVWSTTRGNNLLLAFNATRMMLQPAKALLAAVEVGTAPVGLTFAKNGTRILVADSARFPGVNATSGISVIDVEAALRGRKANLGSIPTGQFPRELSLSPDGRTVLLTVYSSEQIQAIDVSTLP